MVLPKQTNDCGLDQKVEAGAQAARVNFLTPMSSVGSEGAVGKPGGFTNTSDDPRVGGLLFYRGGLPTHL